MLLHLCGFVTGPLNRWWWMTDGQMAWRTNDLLIARDQQTVFCAKTFQLMYLSKYATIRIHLGRSRWISYLYIQKDKTILKCESEKMREVLHKIAFCWFWHGVQNPACEEELRVWCEFICCIHSLPELIRSLKLGNVWVFVHLIHRPRRTKKSAVQKLEHCLTWDFLSALLITTAFGIWSFVRCKWKCQNLKTSPRLSVNVGARKKEEE